MQTNHSVYGYKSKIDELLSTGKNRSYFVASVTVFFILLMSFAGIIPALSSLGVQAEENKKRDELIQKLEAKITQLKSFIREQDEKKETLNFFEQIFPAEIHQEKLINHILDLADDHNVNVNSFSFISPKDSVNELHEEIRGLITRKTVVEAVNILADTTLEDGMNFIESIEKSRKILDIKESVLNRKTGQDLLDSANGKDYVLTLKLHYFYFNNTLSEEDLGV